MRSLYLTSLLCLCLWAPAARADEDAENEFRALRDAYLEKFKPIWTQAQQAWWEANVTGSDEAYARKKDADTRLLELHSDRERFARIESLRKAGALTDPVQLRELDVMYRSHLPAQADPELSRRVIVLSNEVEQIFNTHRSRVGERELSENDVREILGHSTDPAAVEAAWKGYMAVGQKVEGRLRELVALRNRIARELGFENFFSMQLAIQEIDGKELFRLFDELDGLTREPFAQMKSELDRERAARFGLSPAELRPWHFGDLFFQEAPSAGEVNLDELFAQADLIELTRRYYAGIGLPCEDILQRSDLFEKPGKNPHAFSTDLDREGDVRILCNVKPNIYWADTMLHEIGHAVYDKNIRRDVPFLLREASHSITTEGVAIMFGTLVKSEPWLREVLRVAPEQAARVGQAVQRNQRMEKLIFARWAQVMVRFEHGMYAQPEQNLGRLWWELKRQYQMLNPPESVDRPDYAAKIHILTAPVYYHSYLMGELFAAQLKHHLVTQVLQQPDVRGTCLCNDSRVGEFLRREVFGPGNLHPWNELTRRATGEPLTARYFAAEFIR
jgi:peptidyl-dipeptidase A